MKKSQVIQIYQALESIASLRGSAKFAYTLARNKTKLQPLYEAIKKAHDIPPRLHEFHTKRMKLLEKFSVKDKGRPKMVGDQVQIGDQTGWDVGYAALREEYADADALENDFQVELQRLLSEDVEEEPVFLSVPIEQFPDNITPGQMEALLSMIALPPETKTPPEVKPSTIPLPVAASQD